VQRIVLSGAKFESAKLRACKIVIIFIVSGNLGIVVTSFAVFSGVLKLKSTNSALKILEICTHIIILARLAAH